MMVTDRMQTEVCGLIEQATKMHHEIAKARLMSNGVHGASTDLLMALHAVWSGSETALCQAAYNIGQMVVLVPSRASEYRRMLNDLQDAI